MQILTSMFTILQLDGRVFNQSRSHMLKNILVLPLALLSACATLVNGTSQTVTVSTTPPGASCTLDRVGTRVGAVSITPGSVRLDKSKNDLSVTCNKEGFQTATVAHAPSFSGATFGNLIAGGVIGVVVDAASGANYSYPDDIRIDMAAAVPTSPPMAQQGPPSMPGTAIRLLPAAARSDAQPALLQPADVNAMNSFVRPSKYPR